MAQPDLGTMLVLSATVFGVIAVAGTPQALAVRARRPALSRPLSAAIQLGVLEGYQLDRFAAFLDPTHDPRGAGYNTTQARIAIGNGGLFGQGLFHGSQTQSGFVPEQHTDFVFTVAGEELGLVGAAARDRAASSSLLWRAVRIAAQADDMFGRLAGAGIVVLVRLPGVPEHRDVPRHHAGHRRAAAAGVVRRHVDVRLADGGRAAAQHPPAHRAVARPRRRAARPGRPLPPLLTLPRLAFAW